MNRSLLTPLIGLLLTGCSVPPSQGPADLSLAEVAAADARADVGAPDGAADGAAELGPAVARVCATLVDTSGAAVPDTNAIVCDGAACNMATSDAAGALCVAVDAPGAFKFNSFERVNGSKHYGEVLFPLTVTRQQIDARVSLALGQVVVPLLGPSVTLDAKAGGTLALGGGVSLQVPAGSAAQPGRGNAIAVAAAQLAPQALHPRLLATGPAKAPLAAFFFAPAEVTFSAPAGYALPAGGLSPGAALSVFGVDYDTGALEPRGAASVDSAGQIHAKPGQGLTALGWWLVYAE